MKIHVIILRGAQGSGKSTFVSDFNKLLGLTEVLYTFSADFFFQDSKGNYNFDIAKLGAAHLKCYADFKDLLENVNVDWLSIQHCYLVVDNTNCDPYEIAPYIMEANLRKADTISIVTCTGEFQNVHDVPEKSVLAKRAQIARTHMPFHWREFMTPTAIPQDVHDRIHKVNREPTE